MNIAIGTEEKPSRGATYDTEKVYLAYTFDSLLKQ